MFQCGTVGKLTLFVEKCRINIENEVLIYLMYIQDKRYSDFKQGEENFRIY